MMFKDFCLKTAVPGPLNVYAVEKEDVPERYKEATESMIDIMINKMDILDRVNVPFIEMAFDEDYETILNEKTEDGEVPDVIIGRLTDALYKKYPSQLDEEQSAIIKVLATYICIQN